MLTNEQINAVLGELDIRVTPIVDGLQFPWDAGVSVVEREGGERMLQLDGGLEPGGSKCGTVVMTMGLEYAHRVLRLELESAEGGLGNALYDLPEELLSLFDGLDREAEAEWRAGVDEKLDELREDLDRLEENQVEDAPSLRDLNELFEKIADAFREGL